MTPANRWSIYACRNNGMSTRIYPEIGERAASCRVGQRELAQLSHNGRASETAAFRVRAARGGDEGRALAASQSRLRVPAGAGNAAPARPWLARGISWIRDGTRRTASGGETDPSITWSAAIRGVAQYRRRAKRIQHKKAVETEPLWPHFPSFLG
jgi:hypothetical protein